MALNADQERAIIDAVILQGWREATDDFDWEEMEPCQAEAEPTYDFAIVRRLMADAQARERQSAFRFHDRDHSYDEDDKTAAEADMQRYAARKGGELPPETQEVMRRMRNRHHGLSEDGDPGSP